MNEAMKEILAKEKEERKLEEKRQLIKRLLELRYMYNEINSATVIAIGQSKFVNPGDQFRRHGTLQMFHTHAISLETSRTDDNDLETRIGDLGHQILHAMTQSISQEMSEIEGQLNSHAYQADGRICMICGTNVFVKNGVCKNGHNRGFVGFEHLHAPNSVESSQMQNAVAMLGVSRQQLRDAIINHKSLEEIVKWKNSGYISIETDIPLEGETVHVLREHESIGVRLVPDTLTLRAQPDGVKYWQGLPMIGARAYDFNTVKYWLSVKYPES